MILARNTRSYRQPQSVAQSVGEVAITSTDFAAVRSGDATMYRPVSECIPSLDASSLVPDPSARTFSAAPVSELVSGSATVVVTARTGRTFLLPVHRIACLSHKDQVIQLTIGRRTRDRRRNTHTDRIWSGMMSDVTFAVEPVPVGVTVIVTAVSSNGSAVRIRVDEVLDDIGAVVEIIASDVCNRK